MRRVHLLSTVGDTFTTVALAGSLFFSISPTEAKGKITLYLLLTVAPFGVVAPFLGPILDRKGGSRRALLSLSFIVRAVFVLLMSRDLNSVILFPEAFTVLVASKIYLVTKAAVIPELARGVTPTEANKRHRRLPLPKADGGNPVLVFVNSSISLLAAVGGFIGGALAAAVLKFPGLGAPWVLRVDFLIFILGITQVRLIRSNRPKRRRGSAEGEGNEVEVDEEVDEVAEAENAKRSPQSVILAAAAMSVLRGSVGFFTFFIAFNLRRSHAPAYFFGLILGASAIGSGLATAITPKIRRFIQEEILLIAGLVVEAILGIVGAAVGDRYIQILLALVIGFVASSGKLAFDSLVQFNILPTNQGKAFSKYETRFQLAWVIGGLIPTIVVLPLASGDLTLAFSAVVAATSFSAGRSAVKNLEQ
jgi:MFS family permease